MIIITGITGGIGNFLFNKFSQSGEQIDVAHVHKSVSWTKKEVHTIITGNNLSLLFLDPELILGCQTTD